MFPFCATVKKTCLQINSICNSHNPKRGNEISSTENKRGNVHWGAFVQPLLQWKSNKYYTTWACICSPRYLAGKAHAPYCHLLPAPLYIIFPHYLINSLILEKKLLNIKCVLIFSTTFVWNISHSRKNWARYDKKGIWVFM